jgi:hypothetical protein
MSCYVLVGRELEQFVTTVRTVRFVTLCPVLATIVAVVRQVRDVRVEAYAVLARKIPQFSTLVA